MRRWTLVAGLAFALQKVITAVAGYFVILRGKTFNVGDRIVMGGVRGDVIALGFMQTTIMEMGQDALREMERRYVLQRPDIKPRVSCRLTDNWLELTVRFVARDHGVREVKDAMSREILAALDEAGIGIASATMEIVGLPPLRLDKWPDLAPGRPPRSGDP